MRAAGPAERWASLPNAETRVQRRVVAPPQIRVEEDRYERNDRAVLLFNGECSVCSKISSWVIRRDDPKNGGRDRLDERPIGHDPSALPANIDIWDAYEKVHVVLPNGEVKKGGEAVGEVLRRLPLTKWIGPALDFDVFGFKPVQKVVDAGYYVLDRLRPAMGCESCGTPVPWWGKPVEWMFKAFK